MPHNLVVGMTESGKTSLAKLYCDGFKKSGIKTMVLDPVHDTGWNADFQTHDPEMFLKVVKSERNCMIFVDESGSAIGRYNSEMEWLATTSRHLGHSCWFIMQDATQVAPIIRGNCTKAFVFACDPKLIERVASEWNEQTLRNCERLPKFCFYVASRFDQLQIGEIDLTTGTVSVNVVGSDQIPNEDQDDGLGSQSEQVVESQSVHGVGDSGVDSAHDSRLPGGDDNVADQRRTSDG